MQIYWVSPWYNNKEVIFLNFLTKEDRIVCLDDDNTEVGKVCFSQIETGVYDINHTFVADSMQGKGIAGQLVSLAIEEIRKRGGKVVASCSYAKKYMEKNNLI